MVYFIVLKEALVVTHCELCFELSEGLKCNTDYDDKRSTTEGEYAGVGLSSRGKVLRIRLVKSVTGEDPFNKVLNDVRSCNYRKNRYYAEEQSTSKSDLVKNLLDIIGGGSTLSDTGYNRRWVYPV